MISEIVLPHKVLQPFINSFWIVEIDNTLFDISAPQRIVPNGMVEIFFHFGDTLVTCKNHQKEKQNSTVIIGQSNKYYDIIQTGKTGFVATLFKPHAVKLFFDLNASDIANNTVDLSLIIPNINEVLEKIALTHSFNSKIEIIERFLVARLNEKMFFNYNRLSSGINLIKATKGTVKISELANHCCLSEKQFYRVFRELTGISTKDFIKVVRVQNAIKLLHYSKEKDLQSIANKCGYYDQSHFIKDFKAFTGYTPKKNLAEYNIYPSTI